MLVKSMLKALLLSKSPGVLMLICWVSAGVNLMLAGVDADSNVASRAHVSVCLMFIYIKVDF